MDTSPGREANIEAIRALEKQIQEGKGDIIKLKRTRNSLLNISTRVPPEILGYIFVWSLVRLLHPQTLFAGLRRGSYNFLLVCHHWFEVASCTSELWSFWGNTLRDWKKRHHRSRTSPLDLVLSRFKRDENAFDASLQDAVRSRVVQDTVRQVHLTSNDGDTITRIISSLTPDDEGGQNKNIESIALRIRRSLVDVSTFFARSHLSKLRSLDLSGNLRISSWDDLASRTTLLTTLSLRLSGFSLAPTITTPQLFSILTSNPNLQQLTLHDVALPNDTDGFEFQVPLRELQDLSLRGKFRRPFGLMRQLTLPEKLHSMDLTGYNSTAEDVSRTFVPYMRDYFRRDTRFQSRLRISAFSVFGSISISANTVHTQDLAPAQNSPFAAFRVVLANELPDVLKKLTLDLITLVPQEHVVCLSANLGVNPPEELLFAMPNIETLTLFNVELSEGFLQPDPYGPRANKKLLPSLQSLHLEDVTLKDGDWGHLTTYLAHQTSDNQTITFQISGNYPYMLPVVVNEVEGLVKRFAYHRNSEDSESPYSSGYSTNEE